MIWELFQRGRWYLLGAFLLANSGPVLILTALGSGQMLDPELLDPAERWPVVIHVITIEINALIFGAALLYFTGSKGHNVALRQLAIQQGLKLNEYGLFRGTRRIAGRTEEQVYERLGLPFVLAVGLMMPVAGYPIYRVTAADTSVAAYWQHLLALPFWPSGPPWFLWVLLVFDLGAAALYAFARRSGEALGQIVGKLSARPTAFVTVLVAASGLAYVPLALAFTPWTWFHVGPFGFQLCRPLLYAVNFLAGLGVGAYGIERGLLAPTGWLAASFS